ncbi:hypothetical protein JTE88_06830 [Arcanobacterium phocisimile]|uniref:Uncharacterized protein n=1 Tax=Arcanobacterium phocisimile TaxID=1302235 RepID=A0ABX7IFQ1_9ACTO|nr:hypothetical protein [Arcanobacterium phocisimile]QRV01801.1 hypothetical protein JTE88_06830 [Arcanobacterium phocisimile]
MDVQQRKNRALRFPLAILGIVIVCVASVVPQTAFAVLVSEVDSEANQTWFDTVGLEILVSEAPDVFSDEIAENPDQLTLGTAIGVYEFTNSTSAASDPQSSFVESQMWIAPVFKDAQAVGVVLTEGRVSARRTHTEVVADVRLATEVAGSRAGSSSLIYDEQLDAWFTYRDSFIEPGDMKGAEYVLGSVPFDIFMTERAEAIASDTAVPAPNEKVSQSVDKEDNSLSATRIVIVVALLASLAIFSLAWLKWDEDKRHSVQEWDELSSGDHLRRHIGNRWDPFAKARLLIHPHGTQPTSEKQEKEIL